MPKFRLLFFVVVPTFLLSCFTSTAQEAAGNEADAHNPSGPAGPIQSSSIWKVDSLTGALTLRIPVARPLAGGRGTHYGQTLLYNSSSTITLQSRGVSNGYLIYNWVSAGNDSSSFAPPGPWIWNKPTILHNSINIPVEPEYETLPSGQTVTVGTWNGCTGNGPYLYYDANGSVHDLNVLTYGDAGDDNDPSNPGCYPYKSSGSYVSGNPNYTIDGSALYASPSLGAIEPDGTLVSADGTMRDSNGNINNGTDSEGRTQLQLVSGSCDLGTSGTGGTCNYTLDDAGGTAQSYSVTTAKVSLGSFNMPHPLSTEVSSQAYVGPSNYTWGGIVVHPNVSGYVMGVTAVDYPDGTAYEFTYDPLYGTVKKVTFPTGGSVTFTWSIRNIGEVTAGVQAESTLKVTAVDVSDGAGNTSHWSYTYPDYAVGQQYPLQSTEVDPDNTTVHHYSSQSFLYSTLFTTGAPTAQETLTDVFASNNAHMRSTATAYYTVSPGKGHPYQVTTTYYDSSPAVQSCIQYVYDQWDNVIEKDESALYPYSSSSCAATNGWTRKTFTSYPTSFCSSIVTPYTGCPVGTPANFDAAHIVNKPSQVLITDGQYHPYSLMQFGYDETPVVASGCGGTGTGCYNHDDTNYGASKQAGRGNLTSESRCSQLNNSTTLSPGSNGLVSSSAASAACTGGFLVTTHAYDLTGQRVSTTDPAGNVTSFSYTDSFSTGVPPAPTNSFLTKITHPKTSLYESYMYTLYTGQETSHSDVNRQATLYSYADPNGMSRLMSITGPTVTDGTSGASAATFTQFSYIDEPYTGSSGTGFQVTTMQKVDAKTTPTMTSSTVTYDGLGRKVTSSTVAPQCSSGIQVLSRYDVMGRTASVTNPYCSTSDVTYGTTQYLYDALGRKIQTTLPDGAVSTVAYAATASEVTDPFNGSTSVQHIMQSDSLGRLAYACEVTSSSLGSGSPASCGLYIGGTGYKTTYGYDPLGNLISVNQSGLVRSFIYDSLSRLVQSGNPEAGTDVYTYDNSNTSPCGLNVGGPCTRTDARGVITAYTYDQMGRLTGKSYRAGTPNTVGGAISDLSSCYQYDTRLSSATDSYPGGQLTLEWQQSGSCPTGAQTTIPSGAVAVRVRSMHDALGHVGQDQQCLTASTCSTTTGIFRYTYNLLGDPVQANNGIFKSTVAANQAPQSSGNGTTMAAPSVTWRTAYDDANQITSSAVQDQPAWSGTIVWPSNKFSAGPTILAASHYDSFGHMTAASLDASINLGPPMLTISRQYDNRGRISYEIDNGAGASSAATNSLGTIVIGGSEQGPVNPAASYATGSVSFTGTEQYYNPDPVHCGNPQVCGIPDAGTLTVTINGTHISMNYGPTLSTSQMASNMATAINGAGVPVTATASGSTLNLRATLPTTQGNSITLAASSATNYPQYFSSPSFSANASGSTLTGGKVMTQVYDSGTVSATINNQTAAISFQNGDTPQTIASNLSQAIQNLDGSFLSAQPDGDVSILVSSSTGTAADYTIATSVTYDSTDFTSASFSAMATSMADGNTSDPTNGMVYFYYVPQGGYAPNGNILVQSDSVMGDWYFNYDAVDRLTSATPDTTAPSAYLGHYVCWTYDAFGNRVTEAFSTANCTSNPTPQVTNTYNAANNRIINSTLSPNTVTGAGTFIYDASGNTLYDGRNEYWYDAAGRLCASQNQAFQNAPITQYIYDAEGTRIGKATPAIALARYSNVLNYVATSPTCSAHIGSGLTLNSRYLVDLGGQEVTEMSEGGSETWVHSNVFVGGRLTATYDTSGIHMALTDPLGTKRVVVNNSGTIEETCTSLPFGNDVGNPLGASCSGHDATEHHFTGKERDLETGNDYFFARYYTSAIGRFVSPDWSAKSDPVPYAVLSDPQSLNLYSYVRNNPTIRIDPDGHGCNGWGCLNEEETEAAKELDKTEAQQKAEEKQKQAAQPPAQQQAVTITPVEYQVINGGVSIELAATVTNSEYTDFNWIQTVTTDHPARSRDSAGVPFIDKAPWEVDDFYITKGEKKAYQEEAKRLNTTVIFEDQPSAVTAAGKPVKNRFHAELSLVGIRKDGSYKEIGHVTWGYTTSNKGVTKKEPLTGVQQ